MKKLPLRPTKMPMDRYSSLKDRATLYAQKEGNTHGEITKFRNSAMRFFISRWKGGGVSSPKWMHRYLPKNYPR